ncbi:hypothetical protein [Streptomyces sp. NPDC003660]
MTPVLRTTAPTTEPTPAPPVLPDGTDPLLRLKYESQQGVGPGATRCLSHPHELAFGGIPATCTACRARRDWMLINHGRNVWIRCRCSNQWLEPEISRADFDAMIDSPDVTNYPSVEHCLVALGFDGALAGTYLE